MTAKPGNDVAPALPWQAHSFGNGATEQVPVGDLLPADSPRLSGENDSHARLLAESEAVLPPIVVHRSTMRVVDGMHRLQAAILRGQETIEVRFYDGDEKDAFAFGVQVNIAHGLPLSLADRTFAAARIIDSHPQWSDRVIATATGLAAKTIGAIRRRSSEHNTQSNIRLGRDGRTRPVSTAAARRLAGELIIDNPDASLREIARAAGVAPSTARDVRERLRDGRDPVPSRQRQAEQTLRRENGWDRTAALQRLRQDPSLRFNEAGRALLRWLDSHPTGPPDWERAIENVPAHCAEIVARLARGNAKAWREFAEQLERR